MPCDKSPFTYSASNLIWGQNLLCLQPCWTSPCTAAGSLIHRANRQEEVVSSWPSIASDSITKQVILQVLLAAMKRMGALGGGGDETGSACVFSWSGVCFIQTV